MELVTLFSSPGRKTAKEMHDDDDETAAVHPRGRKEGRWRRRIMEEGKK